MSMTNPTNRVEIITSVQRRRRWTASEKVRMVGETFEPGMTVSLVARQHGVAAKAGARSSLMAALSSMGLSPRTSSGARRPTSIVFLKAKSRLICQCRHRPNTS